MSKENEQARQLKLSPDVVIIDDLDNNYTTCDPSILAKRLEWLKEGYFPQTTPRKDAQQYTAVYYDPASETDHCVKYAIVKHGNQIEILDCEEIKRPLNAV